jgi:hypothetical protein
MLREGLPWALVLTCCGTPYAAEPQITAPQPTRLPNACDGARTLTPEVFAEMTEKLRPGTSEADYAPHAEALFGERESSTFVRLLGECWSGSFIFRGGALVDVWFETAKHDEEGLDEAKFQAMRRATQTLAAALEKRYGAPSRTRGGPTRLLRPDELAGRSPPQPFVAIWAGRDVERCLTLEQSIGKGIRDVRVRFQQKPVQHDWAWSC